MKLLDKIIGDPGARQIKRFEAVVPQINDFEEKLSKLSDSKLKAQTIKFKKELEAGSSLNDILPEAFATVRGGR